ncbi:MAG: T9SS type A sorting domain-containing protein [candidate division Zixibacteria bacterium]|nr:T9SS type A sorting domain-containing protein [candidate division Zixibacteria bacterium]
MRKIILYPILAVIFMFSNVNAEPGDALWTRTYGGSSWDYAYEVQQTADGGYIVAGATESFGAGSVDFYVVKTDPFGDTLWTRSYGGTSDDIAESVRQTADGGYIATGWTESFGAGFYDFYLVKTDAYGEILWTRTFGGSEYDRAECVNQTLDGGYIIAGYTYSFGAGSADFYLVKTDTNGDTLWTRTYGTGYDERAYSLQETADGNYIVAGYTEASRDFYLVKVEGDQPRCCNVDMIADDDPVMVEPGSRFGLTGYISNPIDDPIVTDVWGGVIYMGHFYQQFAFNNIPLNPGQSLTAHTWQNVPGFAPAGTYDYVAYCGDCPDEICDEASFPFTVTGNRIADGATEWSIEGGFFGSVPTEYTLVGSYPNPFNASTTITFELPVAGDVNLGVYNLMGQKVATMVNGEMEAGNHNVSWDASSQASGIYFYRLSANGEVSTRRMILLK